jgi:hypothetical protein
MCGSTRTSTSPYIVLALCLRQSRDESFYVPLRIESVVVSLLTTRFNTENSTWCLLCAECFIGVWERTETSAVYVINWLVFIAVVESVYSAVRTDCLYKADYFFCKGLTNTKCGTSSVYVRGGETFWGRVPKLFINFEKFPRVSMDILKSVCARYLYKKSLLLARHVFRNNSCVLGQ